MEVYSIRVRERESYCIVMVMSVSEAMSGVAQQCVHATITILVKILY